MAKPLLVIGNRNYSSWSLRAWLALGAAGLDCDTQLLVLDTPQFQTEVRRYSPAGRVPVLLHGELCIWDSLAIAEYAAERTGRGWPRTVKARAVARAVSAEMHSGFAALRNLWPMNIRARNRHVAPTPALQAEIARIDALWTACRTQYGAEGPWLFGEYGIADAFFAPVVCRFATYGRAGLGPASLDYVATTLAEPALREWSAIAAAETAVIEHEEVGRMP